MHGDADTLVTPDNLDRLARARPDATVARFAGAGLELPYTAPAQAILIRWFDALRGRSQSAGDLAAAPPPGWQRWPTRWFGVGGSARRLPSCWPAGPSRGWGRIGRAPCSTP